MVELYRVTGLRPSYADKTPPAQDNRREWNACRARSFDPRVCRSLSGFVRRNRSLSGNNFMTAITDQKQAVVPSGFWILLTASLVSSLIMLDSNIVAVSLPSIGRSLGAAFTEIQWVISAYVLTYAALLMASGNFADLRGRRKSMLIGLVVFAVSSAACGLATSSL